MRQILRTIAVCLIGAGFFIASANAQEKIIKNFDKQFMAPVEGVVPVSIPAAVKMSRNDKIQAIGFEILDSLQNAYSYYSDTQQPFIYNKEFDKLITIHRGALPRESASDDILDNLFFKTSDDWGSSWTEDIMVYNSRTSGAGGMARYPSCYGFGFENEMGIVFTAPITGGSGWEGFANGIYLPAFGALSLQTDDFQKDDRTYTWGTDAGIIGGIVDDNPYAIAVGAVIPPEGQRDIYSNNNLAYRRSDASFASFDIVVPDAWASDKFDPMDEQSLDNRKNSIIGLKKGDDGVMYMGVVGVFTDPAGADKLTLGVSASEDLGQNWSDFVVLPYSVINQYGMSLGVPSDSISVFYVAKDMTVLPNGDVCFVTGIFQIDGAEAVPDEQQISHLVEITYSNGSWNIRFIADINSYIIFPSSDPTQPARNQKDWEVQISPTVDGTKLICKWVDVVDVLDQNNEVVGITNDIFVSTRSVEQATWSDKTNLTESLELDRITWIPTFVPNDLRNIPIIKTRSTGDPEDFEQQRELEVPQHVLIGHFNAEVGIEDEPVLMPGLTINRITPNPASEAAELAFSLERGGQTEITIYDALGNKAADIANGWMARGIHGMNINTSLLPAGAYYLVIRSGGAMASQMLTVVR